MPLLIGEGGGLECTQTLTHIQTGADIITAGMGNPTLSTSNWKADSAAPCAKCLLLFVSTVPVFQTGLFRYFALNN